MKRWFRRDTHLEEKSTVKNREAQFQAGKEKIHQENIESLSAAYPPPVTFTIAEAMWPVKLIG